MQVNKCQLLFMCEPFPLHPSKEQASWFPLLSQNNNLLYAVEPPFSDAKSTQLDILKFVFMSVRYLSDLGLNIGRQHPAVMLKVQSSFLSEGHNTVWSLGAGGRELEGGGGGGWEGGRKRWLPCDKRPVPSSQAWETGSAAHKALLWRRGNARSSKIRAQIWLSMTGARPPRPHRDPKAPDTSTPPSLSLLHCWVKKIYKTSFHFHVWWPPCQNTCNLCALSPTPLTSGGCELSSSKIMTSESALRWCVKPFVPCLNPPTHRLSNKSVSKG